MPNETCKETIFQRKDGRYCAIVQCDFGKRKYFYGKSETEVIEKIRIFEEEQKNRAYVANKKHTLSYDIVDWFENSLALSLKPKSYDTKKYVIDSLIIPYIGKRYSGDLQRSDIQRLITILSRDYARSTVKKVYDTLNQFYKSALIDRTVDYNPVSGVVLPRKDENNTKQIRFFTEEELKKILEIAVEEYPTGTQITRLGYAFSLLAYTGIRVGEAIALTWADVDFDKKLIVINKNSVLVKSNDVNSERKYCSVVQNSAKTKNSTRTIPMSKKAEHALKKLREINGGFNTVLATSTGSPINHRNLARAFKGIQERAGISNPGSLHSLRHTFATRLIECGVDIKTVSSLLGHSEISITYDTYVHVLEKQKVKAIAELDNI